MSRASTLSGFTTAIGQPTNLNVGVLTCQALSSNDVTFSDDLSLKNLNATSSVNTPGLIVTGISTLGTTGSDSLFINGGTDTHATSTVRFRNNAGNVNYGFIQNRSDNITLGTNSTDPIFFETNNSRRVTVASGGDVGIGTTVPGALLSIESTAPNAAGIRLGFDGPRYYDIFRGSTTNSGYLNFYGSQTGFVGYVFDGVDGEFMRINTSGNVGIGTDTITSFTPTLQVTGTDPAFLLQDNATVVDYFGVNIGAGVVNTWFDDASALVINTATGISGAGINEKVRITSAGSVGIGTAIPETTGALTVSMSDTNEKYLTLINRQNWGYGVGIDFMQPLASGGSVIKSGKILSDWESANNSLLSFYTTGSGTLTEKVRITSSGKLGIGTDNPTRELQLSENGDCAIRMDANNSNANARVWEIGVGGNSSNNAEMTFRTRQDDGTGGSECVRFTRSGAIKLPSGGGIDFSATANSSGTMSSELLDDYEEGTWTPTVFGNSTAGTFNIVAGGQNTGHYTKIGNYVVMHVQWSNVYLTGATGQILVGNFPFTFTNNTGSSGGYVEYLEGFTPAFNKNVSEVDASRTLTLRYFGATSMAFRPQYNDAWDNYLNASTTTWQLDGGSATQRTYGSIILYGYTAT